MGRTCGEPNEIELTIRVLTNYYTAPFQAAVELLLDRGADVEVGLAASQPGVPF